MVLIRCHMNFENVVLKVAVLTQNTAQRPDTVDLPALRRRWGTTWDDIANVAVSQKLSRLHETMYTATVYVSCSQHPPESAPGVGQDSHSQNSMVHARNEKRTWYWAGLPSDQPHV